MCWHHIKTVQVTIVLEGVMVDVKQKGQKVVKFDNVYLLEEKQNEFGNFK